MNSNTLHSQQSNDKNETGKLANPTPENKRTPELSQTKIECIQENYGVGVGVGVDFGDQVDGGSEITLTRSSIVESTG